MSASTPLAAKAIEQAANRAGTHRMTATGVTVAAISAAWRAVASVMAGLLLCCGVALALWSITPASDDATGPLLRGAVEAFAAAQFMSVAIGDSDVTITPLLLTAVSMAVIVSAAGRARAVHGRGLEAVHVGVFALVYALVADVAVALGAPTAMVQPSLIGPFALASISAIIAVFSHNTAWRAWWRREIAPPLQVGARGALIITGVLCLAGLMLVAVGLVVSFSDATAVTSLATGSLSGGAGMFVLCVALLPNAAIAGIGYVTGAGFTIGHGTFSPLAVHTTDLPAIPLLTAVPDGGGAVWWVFAIPVCAALIMAVVVVRSLDARGERLVAVGVAGLGSGLVAVVLAAVAGGGVQGGPWPETGVPALLCGALTAGFVLVVAGGSVAAAGGRAVPWRGMPHAQAPQDDVAASDPDVSGGLDHTSANE